MNPSQTRQQLFLEGPIGRALLTLAIPIIFGQLLQTAYQMTDAFWVGRIGAHAVAAVSIRFPVTFLVIAIGAGLGIAGSVACSDSSAVRSHLDVSPFSAFNSSRRGRVCRRAKPLT